MRTLVLNKSYMPIKHVGWKQAFRLICKGRASVVETYDEIIRTPRDFHFIPSVIRLNYYDSMPKPKVSYSRRAILDRDGFICQYCSKKLTYGTATIDHVLPRSHGGKTSFENTVACCHPCNNRKGNKLNAQAGLTLTRRPRKPDFITYKFLTGKSVHRAWADYLPRKMLDGIQIID